MIFIGIESIDSADGCLTLGRLTLSPVVSYSAKAAANYSGVCASTGLIQITKSMAHHPWENRERDYWHTKRPQDTHCCTLIPRVRFSFHFFHRPIWLVLYIFNCQQSALTNPRQCCHFSLTPLQIWMNISRFSTIRLHSQIGTHSPPYMISRHATFVFTRNIRKILGPSCRVKFLVV